MATYTETVEALKAKFAAFAAAADAGTENKTSALQARKISMELRTDLQAFREVSVTNDRANTKHRAPKAAPATPAAEAPTATPA